MFPISLYRPATFHGIDIFDIEFLSGLAARVVSPELAAGALVLAFSDGTRYRTDHHEHQSRDRGPDRQAKRIRTHAKVQRREQAGQNRRHEIPPAPGMASLGR